MHESPVAEQFRRRVSTISFISICKNQLCGELQIDWEMFQIQNVKQHGVSRICGKSNLILFGKETSTRHILLEIKLQRSKVQYIFVVDVSSLEYAVN